MFFTSELGKSLLGLRRDSFLAGRVRACGGKRDGLNPFHRPGSGCDPDPKYAEVCPTCGRKTVEAWTGASARCAEAAVMIDLTASEASGQHH